MLKPKGNLSEGKDRRKPFSANLDKAIIHEFDLAQVKRHIGKKQDALEQALTMWIALGDVVDRTNGGLISEEIHTGALAEEGIESSTVGLEGPESSWAQRFEKLLQSENDAVREGALKSVEILEILELVNERRRVHADDPDSGLTEIAGEATAGERDSKKLAREFKKTRKDRKTNSEGTG